MNDDIFKQINEACDIVDLVSNYVTLEKRGANYMGLCPFHDEKTPSFSVSPSKKIAVCMGCKKGGSPISFLSQIENIPFMEAAKRLADKYHIQMNYEIKEKSTNKYKSIYEITSFAQKYYKLYLNGSKSGLEALNYLHNRGLNDDTIDRFNIGLSPNDRSKLSSVLIEKGFNEIDILESGVVKKGNTDYYDLFQNRIMFPICDENNNVVGFSGRIFNSNDPSKYVNSPESVIFKKGNILFNLNNAIKDIRKKNQCILVEGQLDVISLYNAGITNAVCSMGTALTPNQAKLIKKYTNNVIIAYDGDNAGQNAILKAIDVLKPQGLNINIVMLEDGLDPDEYLRKNGPDSLTKKFNEYINEYDFKYLYYFRGRDVNNLNHVELIKANIFDIITESKSETLKERLLRRLATDIKVSYDALDSDYNKYNTASYSKKDVEIKNNDKNNQNSITAYDKAIANLIYLSLDDKDALEYILNEISNDLILDERILILNTLNIYYKKTLKTQTTLEEFKQYLIEINHLEFIDNLDNLWFDKITSKTQKDKLRNDSIKRYKKLKIDNEIKYINQMINDPNIDDVKKIELTKQKIELLKNAKA